MSRMVGVPKKYIASIRTCRWRRPTRLWPFITIISGNLTLRSRAVWLEPRNWRANRRILLGGADCAPEVLFLEFAILHGRPRAIRHHRGAATTRSISSHGTGR